MKKNKITIETASTDDFFRRILNHAKKLDRGENIKPGIRITFEDPLEMLAILTSERVRLLRKTQSGALPVTHLASQLRRDLRAVSRDVARLEKAGLLRTSYRINPGHGRFKVVEPVARKFVLTASI